MDAARGTVGDAATLLADVARRAPPLFRARLVLLIQELDDVARDLGDWDDLPDRYADTSTYPQARGPTHD